MRRAAAVIAVLLVAGCSAGGGSTQTAGSKSAAGAGSAARPAAGVAQPAVAQAKPVAVPRSLIRTAEVHVQVRDVRGATAAAEKLAADAGGAVADEQLDLQAQAPHASMRLQVPPARLTATLDRLAALGHEQSRRLGTEDVTDTVVDLDSRLATQQQSVTRVRALLDRATSLTDVVRLESELSRREADLESLQARARAVSGQVAMSDVTVELTAGKQARTATAVGFTRGFRGGWHALLVTLRVSGATVGALLPFLPLLVAAGWAAWWLRRRTATT